MNLQLRKQAILLRKKGMTYSEIRGLLGEIPKGTLSTWFKTIELSPLQKIRIINKLKIGAAIGRQKGGWTNRQKRIDRINALSHSAEAEFGKLAKNPLFFIGLSLYLAEGSRKSERFQFMNSDPRLIKLMIRWVEEIVGIDRKDLLLRLYTHRVYEQENCEKYWCKELMLNRSQLSKTVYKNSAHQIKRNPDYKGCLRIDLRGSDIYWKVIRWGDMMSKMFVC